MIRNLKVLLAAAMALAAFGVLGAASAQAAPEFHCEVEPCTYTLTPDGAVGSKTAHHVFIVENAGTTESVSFTCNQITGEGTSTKKTTTEVTIKNIKYDECSVVGGGEINVNMNGCAYLFKAVKAFEATGKENGTVTIECEAGKKIEVKIVATGGIFTIGAQGPLGGITFHNLNGEKKEVTVETNVHEIGVTGDGTAAQLGINPNQTLTGTYTTGNTIVTAEKDNLNKEMVNCWYE
jgi:hypothetical protein